MADAIPFLDLTRAQRALRADIDAAIARCLDHATYLRGPETAAFEEEWAAYCGQRHAVACNSGTDALTLAAAALGLRTASIPATTLPLTGIGLHRGGAAVTAQDIDDGGWSPSAPDSVPVLLFGRTPPPGGPPAALYDAAHAHGWNPPSGSAAAWSFYPTKSLGGIGDGGAVTTDDAALAEVMRDLAGRDDRLRDTRQITSRLDEVQAAVLRVQLRHLPEALEQRAEIAGLYNARLSHVGLPGPSLHHLHVVRVPRRDALQRSLSNAGIGSKVHWPTPLSRQGGPWTSPVPTPNADRWCAEVLSLPCYPGLTAAEVNRVCDEVEQHLDSIAR